MLVAPLAVAIFVERTGSDGFGQKTGHHKTRGGSLGEVLGFADNAALAAPALARAIWKILEDTTGVSGLMKRFFGFVNFLADRAPQPLILRQTKDEIHVVGLAPRPDVFPAEAAVAANDDSHVRPGRTQWGDDPFQLIHGPRTRVDVRRPEQGGQPLQKAYCGKKPDGLSSPWKNLPSWSPCTGSCRSRS